MGYCKGFLTRLLVSTHAPFLSIFNMAASMTLLKHKVDCISPLIRTFPPYLEWSPNPSNALHGNGLPVKVLTSSLPCSQDSILLCPLLYPSLHLYVCSSLSWRQSSTRYLHVFFLNPSHLYWNGRLSPATLSKLKSTPTTHTLPSFFFIAFVTPQCYVFLYLSYLLPISL